MSTIANKTLEERKAESRNYRETYPNVVPIITQVHERSSLPRLLHNRLNLVPFTFSVRDFAYELRKSVKLSKTTVMSLFIDGRYLLSPDLTASEMYDRWRAEDGFIYIMCADQEQLGNAGSPYAN
jgi:hypothetical protein